MIFTYELVSSVRLYIISDQKPAISTLYGCMQTFNASVNSQLQDKFVVGSWQVHSTRYRVVIVR